MQVSHVHCDCYVMCFAFTMAQIVWVRLTGKGRYDSFR